MLMYSSQKSKSKDSLLIASVVVLYVLQLVITAPYLWAFVGVGTAYILSKQLKLSQQQNRWFLIGLGILTLPLLLSLWGEPSHAILLDRVQNFLTREFGTAGSGDGDYTPIIDMVINSARAIYIVLLVIAGWQAVGDFQQQQETSGFARNMLMSLLGVFAVDVMSALIVPA